MAQQNRKVLETESLAVNQPCLRERRMFRLLLQSNPNYFGNALSSPLSARKPVRCNTWYEEICCLGYNPREKLLGAVVCLHQSGGYAMGTRINSEPEFVRFYLSFDGGKCWEDQGCASVEVHNAAAVMDRQYAVFLQLAKGEDSFPAPQARLRAILSWNDMPPAGAPDWKPVFGNVIETQVCLSSQPDPDQESAVVAIAGDGGEQLRGIGLTMQDNALLAVVHVERKKCLSCYHHVTFWLDGDDSGAFETYLGAVDMPVSALGEIPVGGVDYVLRLPVDFEAYRQDCAENSRVLRVRGILSGSESGSRSDFWCVPAERGYVDVCLTVAPRAHAAPGAIAVIGGAPAKTAEPGEISLPGMEAAPDGFLVQGVPLPRHSYVVEVSADGRNWKPLLEEVVVTDAYGGVRCHRPDPRTGRFEYLPFDENVAGVLACWDGAGVGKWRLRLRNYFGGALLPDSDTVIVHLPDEVLSDDEPGSPRKAGGGKASTKPAGMFAADGMYEQHRLLIA